MMKIKYIERGEYNKYGGAPPYCSRDERMGYFIGLVEDRHVAIFDENGMIRELKRKQIRRVDGDAVKKISRCLEAGLG